MKLSLAAALVSCALLSGCQSPYMYTWGAYEPLVYQMYRSPKDATPEKQIKILQKEAAQAESRHRELPPGFRAHLGYLLTQVGENDAARIQFESEKAHFPESAQFMDHLMGKGNKR